METIMNGLQLLAGLQEVVAAPHVALESRSAGEVSCPVGPGSISIGEEVISFNAPYLSCLMESIQVD